MGREGQQSRLEHERRRRACMTEEDKTISREKGKLYYKKNKEQILERKRKIIEIAKKYMKDVNNKTFTKQKQTIYTKFLEIDTKNDRFK